MNTKTNFLLPHKFQIAGWWGLLASAAIFAILLCTKIYVPQLYTPPILLVTIPFLISLLLICISCEKIDDEYINALRSRIIYYIIIAVVLIKMFYYISVVICTSYGAIGTLGIISFINILSNPIVLISIYIIAFRLILTFYKYKMNSYVEQ